MRPFSCPLFDAVVESNINSLLYLFKSGQGSMFDVDDLGRSALHVSTNHCMITQN